MPRNWNKGLTKETSEGVKKISDTLKGRHCSPRTEFKKGMAPYFSEEHRQKVILKAKRPKLEEHKKKIGLGHMGKPRPPHVKLILSKNWTGHKWSKARNQKISLAHKKLWENPEYAEQVKMRLLKGLLKRPTSIEKKFQEIINKYGLPYRYVGDGSFWVGRRNPDFMNIQYDSLGQKICIEVANRVHHQKPFQPFKTSEDWAENRIKHFAKWGWKCIVFFEDELDEEKILADLK